MDFEETNLPADPAVCRAFSIYQQSQKNFPQEYRKQNLGLRMAQLLSATVEGTTAPVCMALLADLPAPSWGMVGKRFGREMVQLKEEIDRHKKTGYQHIGHGTEDAKLFLMAADIVSMQAFVGKVEGKGSFQDENGFDLGDEGLVTRLPKIDSFENFLAAVAGTTSSLALENLYAKTLDEVRAAHKKQLDKMREMGMDTPDMPLLTGPAANDGAAGIYPPFEQTGIAYSEQARAAYEIVSKDKRTQPDNLFFAIEAAQILSEASGNPNPDAIALLLLDVCIPHIVAKDLMLWEGWGIGRNVTDALAKDSLNRVYDSKQILRAPEPFRQAAFASAIVSMQMLLKYTPEIKNLKDMIEAIEGPLKGGAAGVSQKFSQSASADFEATLQSFEDSISDLTLHLKEAERIYVPAYGSTGLPKLEEKLKNTLREINDDLASLDKPRGRTSQKPPAPPKKGFWG